MDAIMGYGSSLYGSILNGLDIVAATYQAAGNTSYPVSAKYGLVVAIRGGIMIFPVCFKVGIAANYLLYAMAGASNSIGHVSVLLTTAGGSYNTGDEQVSIIWFG